MTKPPKPIENTAYAGRPAWSFLRQLDAAMACVGALEVALARRDRDRVSAILMALHTAWSRAEAQIEHAEQIHGAMEWHARDALNSTREAAARAMAQAAELFGQLLDGKSGRVDN